MAKVDEYCELGMATELAKYVAGATGGVAGLSGTFTLNGATRNFPWLTAAIACSRNLASIPNGTSLTVPIISPSTTALKAGNVAKVIASSIRLRRSTIVRFTTRIPDCEANKLARPVKARSTITPSPAKRSPARKPMPTMARTAAPSFRASAAVSFGAA